MLKNKIKGLFYRNCLGINAIDRNYHFADDFFKDGEKTEIVTEPVDKIKLGEKEYTQADLQKLVGLGEIGLEAEQKYKTRIDRVWPQFQTVINEKKALEEKLGKFEEAEKASKAKELEDRMKQMQAQPDNSKKDNQDQRQQFTPEQVREIALKQAEELGIGPQAIRKIINETLQGQQLINDISGAIDEGQEAGWVKASEPVTVEDVLKHMQETGIRNPGKALRDMREDSYIEARTEKLASIKKPNGLPTTKSSNAGAKIPPTVKVTKDNLEQMLMEAFKGE